MPKKPYNEIEELREINARCISDLNEAKYDRDHYERELEVSNMAFAILQSTLQRAENALSHIKTIGYNCTATKPQKMNDVDPWHVLFSLGRITEIADQALREINDRDRAI